MILDLEKVYGADAESARKRLAVLEERFKQNFGADAAGEGGIKYFTSPGRTEIIGNHVDHNGGYILAASITMDTVAAAAPAGDNIVTIISEGYRDPVRIDLDRLDRVPKCKGTLSLVAGMLEAAKKAGFAVGGFSACVSTKVIPSAGVSSSASFEMLIAQIINDLFNDGRMTFPDYARIGQYAENHFWDKGSGLMDQMACAAGGTIFLDFSHDDVKYEKLDFTFDALDCSLVIVNTGKGHADLSAVYSSIPDEMHAVAAELGVKNLWETTQEDLLENLVRIREKLGNDRAILRALHFFTECSRVKEARQALLEGNKKKMLDLINESGLSSARWLQNLYCDEKEQSITLALLLTEIFFAEHGCAAQTAADADAVRGVCRVHGGGFAGVIMSIVPRELTDDYINYMTPYFGRDNIYLTGIREVGAAQLAL